MTVIFSGAECVRNYEVSWRIKVHDLKSRGITPRLATIILSPDKASNIYVQLKEKAAEKIDAKVDIYDLRRRKRLYYLLRLIKYLNRDPETHGIMIQLPLPEKLKKHTEEIIKTIESQKDVDGLRPDSPFVHPTALAVEKILEEGLKTIKKKKAPLTIAVVGASGRFGTKIATTVKKGKGRQVFEYDVKTKDLKEKLEKVDVIISVTGVPKLIKVEMVKKGALVIDVGAPQGDVDFERVKNKAGFLTPVPGGVGPVTVSCLLENLIQAAYNIQNTHLPDTP